MTRPRPDAAKHNLTPNNFSSSKVFQVAHPTPCKLHGDFLNQVASHRGSPPFSKAHAETRGPAPRRQGAPGTRSVLPRGNEAGHVQRVNLGRQPRRAAPRPRVGPRLTTARPRVIDSQAGLKGMEGGRHRETQNQRAEKRWAGT